MSKKSKMRIKSNGEVFTPEFLVNKMLQKIPRDVFANPEKTFFDPACGDGNFLVKIFEMKVERGSTILQSLSTIYGVDIMQDNVEQCRMRLFTAALHRNGGTWCKSWRKPLINNIRCANTMEKNIGEIYAREPDPRT